MLRLLLLKFFDVVSVVVVFEIVFGVSDDPYDVSCVVCARF